MHYLHSRDLFHEVAIIPLFNLVNATDTRSKELSIIQNWRPMYNHPWINRLHPTSTFRTTKITITALSHTSKSSRLWKKVRRRLQTTGMPRFYLFSDVSPSMGWDLLMMLAVGGQLAFDASRRLRSSEFSHLHVFAFHRLANHLEDPPRTRVKALLRQVLQFRGLALPRQCKPLVIQMLAHNGFKSAVKTFIRQQMMGFKTFLVPFHLPSTQVVAGNGESIKDILYNHLRLQKSWTWTTPPRCSCSNFCVQHPQLQKTHGHIASPASLLNISTRLREVLRYSASTEVSPSFRQYLNSTSTKIQQWMYNNGFNNFKVEDWHQFIGEQWKFHVSAAWVTVKSKDLKFLRSLLQDFLVHGRDHAINEIFIFCPYMYWTILRNTFGDQQVYRSISLSPSQAQHYLLQQSKQRWLQRYPWGISSRTSSLPVAYILLKQKKQFQVARPIISYKFFLFAKLFRATAIVLDLISRETLPFSFGLLTFPAMMNNITNFFQNVAADCELVCFNQDLVGFFTSIPVPRIIAAVNWMLQQFMLKYDIDPAKYTFSVSLREKDSKLRVWKGKARAAGTRMYQIWFQDILPIVRIACDSSYFTMLGRVFAQQRGAAIGNQISPILASISVAYLEHTWYTHHEEFLLSVKEKFLCLRYADNRIVLIDPQLVHHPSFQHFLHDDFYQPPVQLEAVNTPGVQCEFLGFDIQISPTYAVEMIMT